MCKGVKKYYMFFIKLSLFISSKSSKNSQQFLLLNVASQVIHFNVNLINLLNIMYMPSTLILFTILLFVK